MIEEKICPECGQPYEGSLMEHLMKTRPDIVSEQIKDLKNQLEATRERLVEVEKERDIFRGQLENSGPTKEEKKEMIQAYKERAEEDLELCDIMNHGPEFRYLKSSLAKANKILDGNSNELKDQNWRQYKTIQRLYETLDKLEKIYLKLFREAFEEWIKKQSAVYIDYAEFEEQYLKPKFDMTAFAVMTEKVDPYPKSWFQMYDEERQRRLAFEYKTAEPLNKIRQILNSECTRTHEEAYTLLEEQFNKLFTIIFGEMKR